MEELKQRVRLDGRNLGRNILKVDGFINHRIDAGLMRRAGEALADRFRNTSPSLVLTAEISGIAPALSVGVALGISVVYARKTKPVTMLDAIVENDIPSRTKEGTTNLYISGEHLKAGERVLIIDDFLASGRTINALAKMVVRAGSTVVGIGALIEKEFEDARSFLCGLDVPIEALVTVVSMDTEIKVK